jgi:hypothetical protein
MQIRPTVSLVQVKLLAALGFFVAAQGCADEEVGACDASPCQNGGACIESANGAVCLCPAGFDGASCETPLSVLPGDCAAEPCDNGGSCIEHDGGFACLCAPGYGGATCATNLDDCDPNPCSNGGVCSDAVDGYSCSCPAGFEGPSCGADIDECAADPCLNGSSCVNEPGSYACLCAWPSTDPHCACEPGGTLLELAFADASWQVTPSQTLEGVTITGSNALQLEDGLGIMGGIDQYIDGGEWMHFELHKPGFVTFSPRAGGNLDSDAFMVEMAVEAWDHNGISLGIQELVADSAVDVSALFGGAFVSAFRISMRGDGMRVGWLTIDPCD